MRIDLSIGSRDGPLGLTLLARYPISAVDVSTGARIETVATLPLAGERVFSATLVCPAPGRWQVHSPA